MSNFVLNEDQKQAVYYDGDKPLLIEAGPGAGKTRVLVERVKFLIKDKKINPESLLVITFTVKAAEELKERLSADSEIGVNTINKMQISTIHGFCFKLLSEYGSPGLDVIDDDLSERKDMFLRKHKKDLGFEKEYYIPNSQLSSVMNKFEEYSTFKVDTEGLLDYIKNTRPIDDSYIEFIEDCVENSEEYFEFPYDDVRKNDTYKESWYNAKYYAIAKAYPKYMELLKKESSCDYNSLQIKAMNLLKKSDIRDTIRFKNILIDEFQDTDPIQMQIFNALLEGSESFTIVGDDDQSIYGFRGSFPKFFTDFSKTHDSTVITLKTNYRSTPEIVEFNENFIKEDRAHKKELIAARDKHTHVFYMENESKDEQAERIAATIKHLKSNGKIKQYSDVGLLFRALHSGNGLKIEDILIKLDEENIPFSIKTDGGLMDYDAVKGIITLLWYMTRDKSPKILTKWEKEWLNLTAFTDENYNASKMFHLSNETMNILSKLEEDYRNRVVNVEHEVYEEMIGKKSRIQKFEGVFNRDEDILDEIFKRVDNIDLSLKNKEELINLGITNPEDLEFFNKLYNIKKEFYNPEIEFYQRPTILETYYHLLNLTGYFDNKFNNDSPEDEMEMMNLALISNTIYNYENMIYKHDMNGLFWFLNSHLDDYGINNDSEEDNDKVQIMTIHKSKGLEFPVVILGSLEQDVFPRKYDPEREQADYIAGQANYYTPNKFLEYKNHNMDLEKENYEKEENRTIYVALTRAEDILIVSSIPHKTRKKDEDDVMAPEILRKMKNCSETIQELTLDNLNLLDFTDSKIVPNSIENLNLSFSNFSEYEFCPHKYDLIFNYHFQNSTNISMTYGLLVHSILNKIHTKSKTDTVTREDIDKIITETLESNENINKENDKVLTEILSKIYDYWEEYGKFWNVLGSEIPFSILRQNYNLNGQIDLIIKEDDTNNITLIDFKTTTAEKVNLDLTKYRQQLYIYMIALRDNPDFKKYNINKVMIFTIKDTTPIYIDINEKEIEELNQLIDDTANKIIYGEYDRHLQNCGMCEFKYTVCKNVRKLK